MNRFIVAVLVSAFWLCVSVHAQTADSTPASTSAAPISYGLVVDNSGSFRLLIDQIINVVSGVVDLQEKDDEAFLVTFVDTPKIVLRQELTKSKPELKDAAQNMFIEGGQTAILDAMKSASDYLAENADKDSGRLKALVLVTDGEDRQSKSKIEDVIAQLRDQKIRVFVIAMSDVKVVTKVIARLSKETGGSIFTPKNRGELANTAKEVAAAMRK